MQDVAELVEEGLDLAARAVAQQAGLVRPGRRQVGDDGAHRGRVAAVRAPVPELQREGGGVIELALAREEVGVEVGDQLAAGLVADLVQRHVRVPGLGVRDAAVLEPEDLAR